MFKRLNGVYIFCYKPCYPSAIQFFFMLREIFVYLVLVDMLSPARSLFLFPYIVLSFDHHRNHSSCYHISSKFHLVDCLFIDIPDQYSWLYDFSSHLPNLCEVSVMIFSFLFLFHFFQYIFLHLFWWFFEFWRSFYEFLF